MREPTVDEKCDAFRQAQLGHGEALINFIDLVEAEMAHMKALMVNLTEGVDEARAKVGLGKMVVSENVKQTKKDVDRAAANISVKTDAAIRRLAGSDSGRTFEEIREEMLREGLPEDVADRAVEKVRAAQEAGATGARLRVEQDDDGEWQVEVKPVDADTDDCDCPACSAANNALEDSAVNLDATLNGKDRLL